MKKDYYITAQVKIPVYAYYQDTEKSQEEIEKEIIDIIQSEFKEKGYLKVEVEIKEVETKIKGLAK